MTKKRQSFSLLPRSILMGCVMMLSAALTAHADDLQDCLTVHMLNGSKVIYVLDDQPTVNFADGKLHVESNAVSDEHDMTDVAKFTFDKTSSATLIDAGDRLISVRGTTVRLEGFVPGTAVILTDMHGRNIASATVSIHGTASVSIADIPAGVYVVSTSEGKSFKLFKK